jgi:uncharacterized membrane protein YdjX (TVP38/TMEM64 family)
MVEFTPKAQPQALRYIPCDPTHRFWRAGDEVEVSGKSQSAGTQQGRREHCMAGQSGRREYISLAVLATVLVAAVWLARTHAESIKEFIDHNAFQGVVVYIALNILDAVIAPGATLPLIPIAAKAWGRIPAALVTTIGWTTGSLVAFYIARRWGTPIVKKLTSIDRVKRLRPYVPKHPFWSVVLLRLVVPMDVISYVLGLFTDMTWSRYALATALGLTPSAFILTYIGKTPRGYDFIMFGIGGVIVGWIVYSTRRGARKPALAKRSR